MPLEGRREYQTKRIYNPDNNAQFIDVQVIKSITFVDADDRYQETVHIFLNDEEQNADRQVHAVTVTSTVSPPDRVEVERIDVLKVVDPNDRYQETQFSIDNVTGEDFTPPHFSSHFQTHVKRVFGTGDNAQCYVDIERIDKLRVVDPSDRYQESIYQLDDWSDET